MNSDRYVIGIDGGGTSTVSVIADLRGNILSSGMSGASSLDFMEFEESSKSILSALLTSLKKLKKINRVEVTYIGVSGFNKWTENVKKKKLEKELLKVIDSKKIIFDDDCDLGLASKNIELFSYSQPYVVILSGTGVGCYGINKNGRKISHHGWGYLVGDEGGGYDIGKKALIAVLQSIDKRIEETSLRERFVESKLFSNVKYFNSTAMISQKNISLAQYHRVFGEIEKLIYEKGLKREEVASLAPFVVEEAKKGDHISKRILRESGRELGKTINSVIRWLNMENDFLNIIPVGGVFRAENFILDSLKREVEKLNSNISINIPIFYPVTGAIIGAYNYLDIKIDQTIKDTLISFIK